MKTLVSLLNLNVSYRDWTLIFLSILQKTFPFVYILHTNFVAICCEFPPLGIE